MSLSQPLIPLFIISLDKDADRRANIRAQLGQFPGFESTVVRGIDGALLPQVVRRHLVKSHEWAEKRGTIGCFLSHVRAWEYVAQSDASFCVVIEDDVVLNDLDNLIDHLPPTDCDFAFINNRMSLEGDKFAYIPIHEVLSMLDTTRVGLGGDGYVIRPAAASKLLDACRRDGYFGHVDGRLLRYVVGEPDLQEFGSSSWIGNVVRAHHSLDPRPALGIIKGYGIRGALVTHRGGASSREAVDISGDVPLPLGKFVADP